MLNMEDTSLLVWSMVFGVVGFGFFSYERKQRAIVPLSSGICLFVVPYFISNLYMLIISGLILIALPYFVKI